MSYPEETAGLRVVAVVIVMAGVVLFEVFLRTAFY